MKTLIVGDLSVIASYAIDRLPDAGSNLVAKGCNLAVSGVAANIAWDIRDLAEVAVVGAVGSDAFGSWIVDDLARRGVEVGLIRRLDEPTSVFTILVDARGERTMIGSRGASARVVPLADEILGWAPDWCHVSGYTLLNASARERFPGLVKALGQAGIACSVDLEGIADTDYRIDIRDVTVFCNRREFKRYFGCDGIGNLPGGGGRRLIVKAGHEGCYSVEGGAVTRVPALQARVVDCTGAGDAFNAGYIAACLRGLGHADACAWGNAAASVKVARSGPRAGITVDIILETLRRASLSGGVHLDDGRAHDTAL